MVGRAEGTDGCMEEEERREWEHGAGRTDGEGGGLLQVTGRAVYVGPSDTLVSVSFTAVHASVVMAM